MRHPSHLTAACAVLVLALAGCGGGSDATDTTSTSSSEPTYDESHATAEAERVDSTMRDHDPNASIPDDADWISDRYRQAFNEDLAELKKAGVTTKGKVETTSMHLAESNPDAAGGWDLSMYVCAVSTVRLYDRSGKDVTSYPDDTSKPLPKGPHEAVYLRSYVTPDEGKSWQVDRSQRLTGKEAKEASCDDT